MQALARDRRLRQELESGRVETVRQNLIPSLDHGFLDRGETGKDTRRGHALRCSPWSRVHPARCCWTNIIGSNFAILSHAPLSPQWMDSELAVAWRRRGGCMATIRRAKIAAKPGASEPGSLLLKEQGHLFADWMAGLDAVAVIVRPDKYVYSVARTPSDLDRQVRTLLARLDD